MPGGKGNIKPSDGRQFEANNKIAEKWTEKEALRFGNDLLEWMRELDENIFFEDFIYLKKHDGYAGKIYVDLIGYLCEKFSSFFDLIKEAKKIEEIKLKKFSAFDKLNPSISKFLLSAQFGYAEKSESNNKNTTLITWNEAKTYEAKSETD